jgi:hypothetical protein
MKIHPKCHGFVFFAFIYQKGPDKQAAERVVGFSAYFPGVANDSPISASA